MKLTKSWHNDNTGHFELDTALNYIEENKQKFDMKDASDVCQLVCAGVDLMIYEARAEQFINDDTYTWLVQQTCIDCQHRHPDWDYTRLDIFYLHQHEYTLEVHIQNEV